MSGVEPFDPLVLPALNGVPLGTAAATYAAMGAPVHPLLPGGKKPATPHGVLDATTDVDRVDRWWETHPDHNIGAACGHLFDVLDVDVKGDAPGAASLARLVGAGLVAGAFAAASTPTGGRHLLYAPDPAETNHTGRTTGLDFRARGGYVAVAPSLLEPSPDNPHLSAPERYRWTHAAAVSGSAFPWVAAMRLLAPPIPARTGTEPTEPGDVDALVRFVEQLESGNRNHGLFWAATRAASEGHDPAVLRAAALSIGLSDHEVTATLRSAARRRNTA